MERLSKKGDIKLTLAAFKSGRAYFRKRNLNAVFKVTTHESETDNVVLLYVAHIFKNFTRFIASEK